MRIYKIAQVSSIMYQGSDAPKKVIESEGVVTLTPEPTIAKHNGPIVSAYVIGNANYFIFDIMDNPPPIICRKIKSKGQDCKRVLYNLVNNPNAQLINLMQSVGYDGVINGDYLSLFDKNSLRYLGIYDFEKRTVIK